MRYCSNIVPPGPSIFYLPSAKAVITSLSDERERSLYAGAAAKHIGYKTKREDRERAPNHFVKFLCECLLNIVNGNVPIRKRFSQGYEKSFRKLLSRQTSLKEKRQLFARETDLVKIVGFACYRYLTKS